MLCSFYPHELTCSPVFTKDLHCGEYCLNNSTGESAEHRRKGAGKTRKKPLSTGYTNPRTSKKATSSFVTTALLMI